MRKLISWAALILVLAGAAPSAAGAADLSGKWEMTVEVPGGSHSQTFDIEQTGDAIAVKWTSDGRDYKGSGTVDGDAVEWTMVDGGQSIPFTGTVVQGDPLSMNGQAVMPDGQKLAWKAVRQGAEAL